MNLAIGIVAGLLFMVMAASSIVRGLAAAGVAMTARDKPASRAAVILGARSSRIRWMWVAVFVASLVVWLSIRRDGVAVASVVVLPCYFAALVALVTETVARVRRSQRLTEKAKRDTNPAGWFITSALVITAVAALAWIILDAWVKLGDG